MAHGIGSRLSRAEHEVTIQTRDLTKAENLAAELGKNAQANALDSEIVGGIVILAIPFIAYKEVIKAHPELDGKIVVDISNPIDWEKMEFIRPEDSSATEE